MICLFSNSPVIIVTNMFYTYAHYRPDGRVFYIGKGSGNRYLSVGRSSYWKNVVAKEGGFTAEILARWPTEKEAFEHEKFLIKCFKDLGFKLCNLTDGGEGASGRTLSLESRDKLRQFGCENGMYGSTVPQERRDRISATTKKSLAKPDVKARMCAASSARKHSQETRDKIKESWSDPEIKASRLASIRAGKAKSKQTLAEGAIV